MLEQPLAGEFHKLFCFSMVLMGLTFSAILGYDGFGFGLLPSLHRIVVEGNIPSTPTTIIIWGRKPSDGLTKFPQLSIPKQVPMLPNQVVGSTYQTTSSDIKPDEINLPKDVARGLWGLGHNTHW